MTKASGVDIELTYDALNKRAKYLIYGSTTSNQTDRGYLVDEMSFPSLTGSTIRTFGISAASSYIGASAPNITDADHFFNVPFPNRVSGNYSDGFVAISVKDNQFSGCTLPSISGDGYTGAGATSNNALVVRAANAGNVVKFTYDIIVGSGSAVASNDQCLLFKVARFGSTSDTNPNSFEADLRSVYHYNESGAANFPNQAIRIEAYDNAQTLDKRYILCVKGMSDSPPKIIKATRSVETMVPRNLIDGTITNG